LKIKFTPTTEKEINTKHVYNVANMEKTTKELKEILPIILVFPSLNINYKNFRSCVFTICNGDT
jgi:hypothetical protein